MIHDIKWDDGPPVRNLEPKFKGDNRMQERITLKVALQHADAVMPHAKTAGAAGLDLTAIETVHILPHTVVRIATGVHVAIPHGYEGQLRLRSSLGLRGLCIPNAPGTIDSDYRGEIGIMLVNLTDMHNTVFRGDRIAQLVIAPVPYVTTELVHSLEELGDTERGQAGFGSTGR